MSLDTLRLRNETLWILLHFLEYATGNPKRMSLGNPGYPIPSKTIFDRPNWVQDGSGTSKFEVKGPADPECR